MKKFYFLVFVLFALVACEVKPTSDNEFIEPKTKGETFIDEDEPFEPMIEDYIEISFPNPFGDVGVTEERAREIVEEYLDSINPNFSIGESSVSSGFAGGFYYTFEILYKEVRVEKHWLVVYYNDFVSTMVSLYGESLFYNDISVKPKLTKKEAKIKLKESDSQTIDEFITSEGELLIYQERSKGVYLCYKFVVSPQGVEPYCYYISAKNGDVVAKKQDF
jgi:hypothetical protein